MILRRRGGRKAKSRARADIFEEIGSLERTNREGPDPEAERRILRLRHEAGAQMVSDPPDPASGAEPAFDLLPEGSGVPEVAAEDLTPELVRAGILRSGCLLVRGYISREEAEHLVSEIDRSIEAREAQGQNGAASDGYYEEFVPEPPFGGLAGRQWVSSSGVWAADSPRLMFEMTEAFERSGLRSLVSGYLGERPALSVQKCTMRRVSPDAGNNGWHQDGAFLGDVRALNVWLCLSRCGDEAPGLDLVLRRLDHIVPTGTEGAAFDWSVSPAVAEDVAGDIPIVRPIFEPGDMLLFDDLFLHKTAASTEMPNSRYAVESWFFSPSAFPDEYVPIAY
jgi:hypothetical protein